MWMEKLEYGVLRVMTPLGPRYIQPSFWQRVYLVWMFRHFQTLPQIVLSRRQQQLIDRLWAEQRFVYFSHGWAEAPILGTVERRPVVGSVASRDVNVVEMPPLAADSRQQP